MSANPTTTFDLVNANTMDLLWPLGEAVGRSFKPVFNGPGSFSFTLPLDGKAAQWVVKRATGVLITRNTKPIWSGGVTNVVRSAAANTMQVTATGWLEELDHRYVRKDEESLLKFTDDPGGQIVAALITICNAQMDTANIVRPVRISAGPCADTQTRTRTYHVGDNYGASIRELMSIENGVDFLVDPMTRVLTCVPPTAYIDRPKVAFGWGVEPRNLSDAVETGDATNLFNRISATTSSGIVTPADDQEAIDRAGVMLEEWTSLSDVSDVNIAAAFANAELVVKKDGLTTYQITPQPYGDLPRPYDDFDWGDKCYFSVEQGSFKIDSQAVRMFAGTINYTDEGDEVIAELEVAMSG
jgi:hypothetical protein